MFKKKNKIINHPKKPNCKTCQYRKECKTNYSFCHTHTGFTTPCYSCKLIGKCTTYQIHVYKKWHVMECPKWELDKNGCKV